MRLQNIAKTVFSLLCSVQLLNAAPTVMNDFLTSAFVNNMDSDGTTLYVANGTSGLKVYDVSDPMNPTGTLYNTGGNTVDSFPYDGKVYVSDANDGLVIYDNSDLSNPIATISLNGASGRVIVVDGYAYVAGDYRLSIVDLDAATPAVVGTFDTDQGASEGIRDIKVIGDRAYMVGNNGHGLKIINITNKTAPYQVGQYAISGASAAVEVIGSYAFVTASNTTNGLLVLDISNESSISLTAAGTSPKYLKDMRITGGVAYITTILSGSLYYDVSDPANPTQIASLDFGTFANSVAVSGNRTYMSISDKVYVIDSSDLRSPVVVGIADSDGTSYQTVSDGNYTYIAKGAAGIQIVDTSDPASPSTVLTYDNFDQDIRDVDVSADGNYLFAVAANYVYIIDVTDKSVPILKRDYYYPDLGAFTSVKKRTIRTRYADVVDFDTEDLLLVTDFDNGLHIFSFTSDYTITLNKSLPMPDEAPNGSVYGPMNCEIHQSFGGLLPDNNISLNTAVYVAANQGGFVIVDLDETNTSIASIVYEEENWSPSTQAYDVTTLNGYDGKKYLFFAAVAGGISQYELLNGNIFNPVSEPSITTSSWPTAIGNFNDDYLVVSNYQDGVFIIDPLNRDNNYSITTATGIYRNAVDISVNTDKNTAVSIEQTYGDAYIIDLKSLLP